MEPYVCRVQIDLERAQGPCTWETLASTTDALAHRIEARVTRGGAAVDLSGCEARLYVVRADGTTHEVDGEIGADGCTAAATLDDVCYEIPGGMTCTLAVLKDGAALTAARVHMTIGAARTDAQAEPTGVIPSVSEIAAEIAHLREVTAAANAAADRVNSMMIGADGLAGDSNRLGGKPPEYYLQTVNLLDNSNFGAPVNQRGASSYAGASGHTIDRWALGTSRGKVVVSDGKILYSNTNPGGGSDWWQQFIGANLLNSARDAGKTYTLAAKVDGAVHLTTLTIPAGGELAVEEGKSIALVYSSSAGAWCMRFISTTTTEMAIEWAVLYEGAYTVQTLPPYVPRPYVLELLECQRRYHVYAAQASRPGSAMDCCPPMETDGGARTLKQGTVTIGGVACYYNSTEV